MADDENLDQFNINMVDRRAVAAKGEEAEFERLLEEFKPFLGSQASQLAGSSYHWREEMMAAAIVAFLEAVKKYEADKGHFIPYMKNVVRMRLKDALRKQYAVKIETVPLETVADDGSIISPHTDQLSIEEYNEATRQAEVRSEIAHFMQDLAKWGITMEALEARSPKRPRVLKIYNGVISAIIDDADIMQTIFVKRYFPIKRISLLTNMSPKSIERGRAFILATIIIRRGDYEHLKGYTSK